jgi:outer membrane beta-barrel protein
LIVTILGCTHSLAWAQGDLEEQESPSSSEQEVEDLYDKDEKKEEAKSEAKRRPRDSKPAKEAQSLSDLANLAPFSDVAVIQRRFLPKSDRFELTGGMFTNINNPFFNAIGLNARLAYYLTERYAIEGIVSFATTSTRQVTDDLESRPGCGAGAGCTGITTDNVVTSNGFYGLAFKWNPIYGKITWLNKTIVPFDLNFNAGFGMTSTTEDEMEPTLHLGTSQVFALSKGMAFRWDLIWNMYQATATDDTGATETLSQNDLFLGIGMSFYFPEATYR